MNPKTSEYQKQQHYQENEILEHAAEIQATRYVRSDALTNPDVTKEYVRCKLGSHERAIYRTHRLWRPRRDSSSNGRY